MCCAGTTLSNVGLLYVTGSVYQMLRGSNILFTGLLSWMFLKRKLYAFHWIGMVLCRLFLCSVRRLAGTDVRRS
jgi:drug/metabolite transporter (DMT)-like permease